MGRLPKVRQASDSGFVYVARRGKAYKIGFSRRNVARRARDARAVLVLVIPTGQRPSALEYIVNKRFIAKRLPSQGDRPGDKREWFALSDADIDWLRGFAKSLVDSKTRYGSSNPAHRNWLTLQPDTPNPFLARLRCSCAALK